MSETSSRDLDGDGEPGSASASSSDPSGPVPHMAVIREIRMRSQRLALRLQRTQREMESGVVGVAPCPGGGVGVAPPGGGGGQFTKVYMMRRPVELIPGQAMQAVPSNQANRQAMPNAASIPMAMPMPMPMQYHLPFPSYHTVTMPAMAPHPPPPTPMQVLHNMQQAQQSMPNALVSAGPIPTPPATHQRKKNKRTLKKEVDALMEMVLRLSMVWPQEVNAYAGQLIRQSEVLTQLEWTQSAESLRPNQAQGQVPFPGQGCQTAMWQAQHAGQRIDGGSEMGRRPMPQQGMEALQRQRRESEISSNSSSGAAAQNQAAGQGRKRNRKKRDNGGAGTATAGGKNQQSQKTELEAMRAYINKIVQYHIGVDHSLPTELRFAGDFSDLEEHAQRLAAAGYGRIVEEEIRVNRKNNRQAFISMSNDREGLERDGIFLLPVARRYAFEGDKVRAFVLNGGAQNAIKANDSPSSVTGGKPSVSLADDEDLSDETESQDSDADADNVVVISSDNCPKAFVIAITKQTELRQIVGTISFTNPVKLCGDQQFYKFRPYDLRVPMVYVPQESCAAHIGNKQPSEVSGLLYLAHILETDCNGHCIAELLQPVGKVGNLEDELKAILLHNGLKDIKPFEERFNDLYAGPSPPVSAEDLSQRLDLRKHCIFTIDPLTARDLDDAVSIEQMGDNDYEVGVHISDVSHYLAEACELDNIVKERSTSIYLVNEVIHMLPQTMCMRCSLLPGEDKFTFSVFWRMNGEGVMLRDKPRFARTVINSCTQFAYEHAQKIIDNPREHFTEDDFPNILNGFQTVDIVERVLWLHGIARNMRKDRFDNGALTINNAKLRFALDPITGEPQSFEVEQQREANRMIEEFMLLANQSVARFIHDAYPDIAILRNHPPPLTKSLKALNEKLMPLGFNLDYGSSKGLQESMVRLCRDAPDPVAMNACLSQLLMKPMARATYFCSEGKTDPADLWHYALSIPIYTHFTSPIRRYPDIMVHRLLAAALNYCPPPSRTPDELHALTKVANERKYNAKLAGDDSGNLFFKRYVRIKQQVFMTAVVMEIFQYMLNCVTLESGHVISIHYKSQKVLVHTQNAPNYILIADRNRKQTPRKLQLLSVVPIYLIMWDNKLTGFLMMNDQRQQALKEQPDVSRRNKQKQQQQQQNQHQQHQNQHQQRQQQQLQQQQQQQLQQQQNLQRQQQLQQNQQRQQLQQHQQHQQNMHQNQQRHIQQNQQRQQQQQQHIQQNQQRQQQQHIQQRVFAMRQNSL